MVPTALLKFLLRLGDSDDVTTVAVAVVLALLAALPLFPVVAVWAKLYQHCKKDRVKIILLIRGNHYDD
jgi:hypothetical protein